RHGQGIPMEQLPEVTILWVRHCHGCRAIDRDHWFEREELASTRSWTCAMCGCTSYTLLKTRW
ncbi:MAG TPA: hypothetical protein VE712_05075, partial [Actinomycetota bacterium]|nr:hypothetical protein [Actinomycetota bacterium]